MHRTNSTARSSWPGEIAYRRAADKTCSRSGPWKTVEVNDLTRITNRLGALQHPMVLAGGAGGMPVRMTRRPIMNVQHTGRVRKLVRHDHAGGQRFEWPPDHMAPRLLPQAKVPRVDGHLRGLLSRETRRFVPLGAGAVPGLLQIAPGLLQIAPALVQIAPGLLQIAPGLRKPIP